MYCIVCCIVLLCLMHEPSYIADILYLLPGLQEMHLVPGFDLINHNSSSPGAKIRVDKEFFVVSTTNPVNYGEQIYRQYRKHLTLSQSFAYYGLRDNRYHNFKIILNSDETAKQAMMGTLESPTLVCFQNPQYYRLDRFFISKCGLDFEIVNDIANGRENTPITGGSISEFYTFLRSQIERALQKYISDKEILKMFEQHGTSPLTKLVLRQIVSEKKIFSNVFTVTTHVTRTKQKQCLGQALSRVMLPPEENDEILEDVNLSEKHGSGDGNDKRTGEETGKYNPEEDEKKVDQNDGDAKEESNLHGGTKRAADGQAYDNENKDDQPRSQRSEL